MKKMPAKIANTSSCALLRPMAPVVAYDVWTGAADADWKEDQHKRSDNGQFGSGAASAKAGAASKAANTEPQTAQKHRDAEAAHKDAFGMHYKENNLDQAQFHMKEKEAHAKSAKGLEAGFKPMPAKVAGEKTAISHGELKKKLEGMPHEKLTASLKNAATDPKIKKLIEAELDSRANRGTMKGHEEGSTVKPMSAKVATSAPAGGPALFEHLKTTQGADFSRLLQNYGYSIPDPKKLPADWKPNPQFMAEMNKLKAAKK